VSENLGAALERAAQQYGDREAVVDVASGARWTYSELRARTAAFDSSLDRLGLDAGDVVGVLMLNSAEHLVAWLGIPRSGRVLNDLNVRLAPKELEFILGDSGAKALIVDDTFLKAGRTLAAACDTVEQLIHAGAETPEGCLAFGDLMDGEGGPPAPVEPQALAGIFYTGGTTGLPKGAMLTHRNLVANAKHTIICLGYDDGDTYFHAAPMFHLADGASTYAITWIGGGHLIMPAFEPEAWLEAVAAERPTRALLVPTMINMVVNHPALAEHDTSSLEGIGYGASPMPEELLRKAMDAFPCAWRQAYGMTEAAPVVTCLTADDHRRGLAGEEPYASRLRSAGRAVVGVEAEVRRDDGSLADVGEPGEVYVRGPNVMPGYWNRDSETAAVLDADGWYHSGDAAYMDEGGYFFIVDRVKDMIVSGGENVYCTEVENALYEHSDVLETAVFGVPHEQWGEAVHAAVVLREGSEASAEDLVEHCRELIAGFKVPRGVDFHAELPKSGAGKLLKRQLREPYWEGRTRQVG
jgi:long-chain acyl-CoA synthetase